MEFTVKKTDLVNDYAQFVNALNYKFHFKDKDKFEEDLINLIKTIDPSGTYDADAVYSKFINLLLKHGNAIDIEENAIKAVEELKTLGQIDGS